MVEDTDINKMNNTPEIITCPPDADGIKCDGGHGTLGHPRVWYSFGSTDEVECGYCDRKFIKEPRKEARKKKP